MKSFSGATTQDMKSYIQPTINNAPDRINCLHIGTNDLTSKAPNDIANAVVDLAKTIQSTCGAEVVLQGWPRISSILQNFLRYPLSCFSPKIHLQDL